MEAVQNLSEDEQLPPEAQLTTASVETGNCLEAPIIDRQHRGHWLGMFGSSLGLATDACGNSAAADEWLDHTLDVGSS